MKDYYSELIVLQHRLQVAQRAHSATTEALFKLETHIAELLRPLQPKKPTAK